MDRVALVISGGGAKGAYAVGALSVIQGTFAAFDIYAGTSTGALIVPFAMFPDLLGNLRQSYLSAEIADFLNPLRLIDVLRSPGLFDSGPFRQTLEHKVTADLWNRIAGSQARLCIAAVSLQSGALWYLHTGQPLPGSPNVRTQQISSRSELIDAMLASGSMPVYMPPVDITIRGGPQPPAKEQMCDGGVASVLPVGAALAAGATKLVLIALRPRAPLPVSNAFSHTPEILLRVLGVYDARVGEADFRLADESGLEVLTIAPQTDLPGVTLQPSADVMAALMQRGEEDARSALEQHPNFFPQPPSPLTT